MDVAVERRTARVTARVTDESVDVATLLTEARVHGKNALDKATSFFRVRAKAYLSIDNPMSNRALGAVLGGLDALHVKKGPKRIHPLK